eukprot:Sdes_comp19375_c0_seq1m10633
MSVAGLKRKAEVDLESEFEKFQREINSQIHEASSQESHPTAANSCAIKPPKNRDPFERNSAIISAPAVKSSHLTSAPKAVPSNQPEALPKSRPAAGPGKFAGYDPIVPSEGAENHASTSSSLNPYEPSKPRKIIRRAGGETWEDPTLLQWSQNDYRIFVGDLSKEVTDDFLTRYFQVYPSFIKARVVKDKRNDKSRGYGFVSFSDSADYIRAMREMNGKYIGGRPIKLRKSTWKDRNLEVDSSLKHSKGKPSSSK